MPFTNIINCFSFHHHHDQLKSHLTKEPEQAYPLIQIDEKLTLKLAPGEKQIERGMPFFPIDFTANIIAIPTKILLWNRHFHSNYVSPETEAILQQYLKDNGMNDVKVRINQFNPIDNYKRLFNNPGINLFWKSLGVYLLAMEILFPGRLFGCDYYNPFTNTLNIFSDDPGIALHEAGHAKDFASSKHPNMMIALRIIPFVSIFATLYEEWVASDDAIHYLKAKRLVDYTKDAYKSLYPAFGTYCGGAAFQIIKLARDFFIGYGVFLNVIPLLDRVIVWLRTPILIVKNRWIAPYIPAQGFALFIGLGHLFARIQAALTKEAEVQPFKKLKVEKQKASPTVDLATSKLAG